jgi:hypothetical protein
MSEAYEKPPLGLVPRYIREKQRLQEIIEAMDRFEKAGKEISYGWLQEYHELSAKLIKEGYMI